MTRPFSGNSDDELEVPSIPYHKDIPNILFFVLLGITYFFLAPLILPFLFVYFSLEYIVYRNQVCHLLSLFKFCTKISVWCIQTLPCGFFLSTCEILLILTSMYIFHPWMKISMLKYIFLSQYFFTYLIMYCYRYCHFILFSFLFLFSSSEVISALGPKFLHNKISNYSYIMV